MKIGLALGSGSARGWAHIGVIRELEAMGIRPDVIAGSSIGSLIGGAYASDNLDAFEDWVRRLEIKDIVSFLDPSWNGGGLIEGGKLFEHFSEHFEDMDIESMRCPFAAVATDMQTGREVWLNKGRLSDAIRASIALPGLFTPARSGERWYIDGGIVNPVPISLCRALGAEHVIAVNLNGDIVGKHFREKKKLKSEDKKEESFLENEFWNKTVDAIKQVVSKESVLKDLLTPREKNPGMFDVIANTLNIMQDHITRSRMAGDPPDILFSPQLSELGLMEFDQADVAIEEGRRSVQRMELALKDLIAQ
jgi:NTE family protein